MPDGDADCRAKVYPTIELTAVRVRVLAMLARDGYDQWYRLLSAIHRFEPTRHPMPKPTAAAAAATVAASSNHRPPPEPASAARWLCPPWVGIALGSRRCVKRLWWPAGP